MIRFPGATWRGDGVSGGSFIDVPWRIVLHTTETRGLPGYQEGKTAPHLTYHARERRWLQHTSLDTAARALARKDAIHTNRARAIQVEIVCYSAKNIGDAVGGLWVGHLDADQLGDLRRFIGWCGPLFGVQSAWPWKQAFSYGQANASGFRMSYQEWYAFSGVCGHQHVYGNQHWDPGALDWKRLLGEDDTVRIGLNSQGPYVKVYQGALNTAAAMNGWTGWVPLVVDGIYGPASAAATKRYQEAAGVASVVPAIGELDDLTRDLLDRYV